MEDVRKIYKREWYNRNKHRMNQNKANLVISQEGGESKLYNLRTMKEMEKIAQEIRKSKHKTLLYAGRIGLGVYKFGHNENNSGNSN